MAKYKLKNFIKTVRSGEFMDQVYGDAASVAEGEFKFRPSETDAPGMQARPDGYLKEKSEVEESYIPKIQNILEGRAKGGPVSAKTPYLVGESGPEIFAPNVDGSIVNNMRTEKIYQMISSKDAGKINFITMELPPKVMKKEQQDSTQQTAPPVPSISPVNGSNPYMNTTPEIYGIYV